MRLKYKFAVQQVTDFWAAVPVGEDAKQYHSVISLSETSKDIFELLANDISKEELVAKMLEQYEVPADQLAADIDDLLEQLNKEGLLL